MKEIIAYEMQYSGDDVISTDIVLISFQEKYYSEYERIYNECFYEKRKALDVQPYNFYSDFGQLKDKMKDIFLFIKDEIIVGSVACYGNEIDDLVVNREYQNQGIGQKLLMWAINHIRTYSNSPIVIHVAKWNEIALYIYERNGFVITKTEKVR